MALELGNLLGAAANLTTALSKEKSLKAFLKNVDSFGIQVTNNFEVNFSGISDAQNRRRERNNHNPANEPVFVLAGPWQTSFFLFIPIG